MKQFVKKYCSFCGEVIPEGERVCKQCGWDMSQAGPPSSDPGDQKARVGVAAGLAVAYFVMFSIISGTDANARPAGARNPPSIEAAPPPPPPAYTPEPATGEAVALGTLPSGAAAAPAATTKPGALITIKVADTKAANIPARDALQYLFTLPDTEQNCLLVGQLHGVGGFAGNLEVFLLTDDEYIFWNANPAAIPRSSWETKRGSETTLNYPLSGAGTYHLVISNVMSPTPKTVQVKAQVKCTR